MKIPGLVLSRLPLFNPSEAPPWDSRPVSGAGVVHYQLLHRRRSVPTALGPAPLVTASLCKIPMPLTSIPCDSIKSRV